MTKTDFAELKSKLCEFSGENIKKEAFIHLKEKNLTPIQAVNFTSDCLLYEIKKSTAIISELIEIIKLQSEALEFYADPFTYTENEYGEKKIDYYRTYEKGEDSLSETTTRLQKLREGK